MILAYFPRLLILSLALFFLVHVLIGAIVSLIARGVIRRLDGFRPGVAANWIFALRVLPVAVAILATAGLCVPSYLELEPDSALERVGWASLCAAMMGAAIWVISIMRTLRAVRGSSRYERHCEQSGTKTRLPGESLPVWVVEDTAPVFALIGIVRPRLVISRAVLSALSSEQLRVVLRHEHGHSVARDNLKRLLVLLSPNLFRGSRLLENNWLKLIEWAADDWAASDPPRALSLAEGLIRVARMGTAPQRMALASSLTMEGQDLSARVGRLVAMPEKTNTPRHTFFRAGLITVALITLPLAAGVMYAILPSVHSALEYLIR